MRRTIKQAWLTMKFRWRLIFSHDEELNNRVSVENVLLSVASGKRQPLSPDECRGLAMKLGVPGYLVEGESAD